MANNPYVNFVKKGDGTTVMDIRDSTVVANKMASGTYAYDASGAKIQGSLVEQGAATITPSDSQQTAVASGKYTTGNVVVSAVPTETKTATGNGTITPTEGKYLSQVTVAIPEQAATTITPTTSAQTAVAAGKYTTGAVTVAAIQTETKTAVSNGTVTPTSGKYLTSVTVAVPTYDGSVT